MSVSTMSWVLSTAATTLRLRAPSDEQRLRGRLLCACDDRRVLTLEVDRSL
jgi:hypothetical protein